MRVEHDVGEGRRSFHHSKTAGSPFLPKGVVRKEEYGARSPSSGKRNYVLQRIELGETLSGRLRIRRSSHAKTRILPEAPRLTALQGQGLAGKRWVGF